MELLAYLPSPPAGQQTACAILNGELLAYGAGSSVAVIDTQTMCLASSLVGGHRNACVTALEWHPAGGQHTASASPPLLLVSGDSQGRICVWDVGQGRAVAVLDDPRAAAFGAGDEPCPPVHGLAWVTAENVLAVLLHPGHLLLWDYATGSVLWRRDLGTADAYSSLQTDPADRRRVALSTPAGVFAALRFDSPSADRVRLQRFQAEITAGGTLRCAFPGTRDLLLLALHHELIVFDLEFGVPAASTPLPASFPAFHAVLGSFGHAVAARPPQERGIDSVYLSHVDGSLSMWQRLEGLLSYSMVAHVALTPPALKFNNGGGSAHPVTLVLSAWNGLQPASPPVFDAAGMAAALPTVDLMRKSSFGERHPGRVRRQLVVPSRGGLSHGGGPSPSVLVMGFGGDGSVLQWQLPLIAGTRPASVPAALPPPSGPQLLGSLRPLPGAVSAFSLCPRPVLLPGTQRAVTAGVAGTAAGTLELITAHGGRLFPFLLSASLSLAVHAGGVKGVRWLGLAPRAASFSSERTAAGAYANAVRVADFRTGASEAVREGKADAAPLAGIRASPCGSYVLLVFRGLPAEVWAVPEGAAPARLRQIDLQFTTAEWLPSGDASAPAAASGQRESGEALRWDSGGDAFGWREDNLPEQRLAFTLADGRVGVLSVRGRRIQDTKPAMPSWAPLATGEFRATAAAAWGPFVFLGGANGTLARWNTATGQTAAVDAGCGRIVGIYVAPAPREEEPTNNTALDFARVAVLSASGTFAVFALTYRGELRATQATWQASSATRTGRVTGIEWASLPGPRGEGSVLMASLEDGSLALLDVSPTAGGSARRARPNVARGGGAASDSMAVAPPLASPLLLPPAWRALLQLLVQSGMQPAVLRGLEALSAGGDAPGGRDLDLDLDRVEAELWACLPHACHVAWSARVDRRASRDSELGSPASPARGGTPREGGRGTLAEILRQREAAAGEGLDVSPPDHAPGLAEAAAKLGYRPQQPGAAGPPGRPGDVSGRVKSLGGAFKDIALDVASASKGQLARSLGRGSGADLEALATSPGGRPSGGRGPAGGFQRGWSTGGGGGFSSLCGVLRACGEVRGIAAVLSLREMAAYSAAVAAQSTAARMAVAAALDGDEEQAAFWHRLPATLAAARQSSSAPVASASGGGGDPRLWQGHAELAEAAERSAWHAALPRRVVEGSEALQEKRVLELVSLGDLQGAVSLLLASPPNTSARFYRDALCTLGMAFACGSAAGREPGGGGGREAVPCDGGGGGGAEAAARTLFVQAAKVVAANAASVGDTLIGVPLLCSTGQFDDAVDILQDSGLWACAAALAAGFLSPAERWAPMERWAMHAARAEGRLWWAAGLLVACGLVGAALELLVQSGLPHAAAAVVAACGEAGVAVEAAGGGAGGGGSSPEGGKSSAAAHAVQSSYHTYIAQVLQQL